MHGFQRPRQYPLPSIDMLINGASGFKMMSFIHDYFSGQKIVKRFSNSWKISCPTNTFHGCPKEGSSLMLYLSITEKTLSSILVQEG